MQPFLLVKLPEFLFDILNTRTIDANSRYPPIGRRRAGSGGRSIVTSIDVTLTQFLHMRKPYA